jgi:predicted phosphodiesterase
MRVLVISDIHGNQVALSAVLSAAKDRYDAVWCLGDLVGYGPDPNECVAMVQALPNLVCLCGNHDKAALGELDLSEFNADALRAVLWGGDALNAESRAYLQQLSAAAIAKLDGHPTWQQVMLAHGSPRDPIWEYILTPETALDNFLHFSEVLCLIGHSHIPLYAHLTASECKMQLATDGLEITLDEGRFIINPGSVGQPRDHDPRAAYGILDLATMRWEFHRVTYDISKTQARMHAHNLPRRLIDRLAFGR